MKPYLTSELNNPNGKLPSIVTESGLIIHLTQDAYMQQNADGDTWFQALGKTKITDKEYMITWEIINPDSESEDEMCDWDKFEVEEV